MPVYIGTALLTVNQRVGWFDMGGPNLLAVVLRSDIWFAMVALLATLLPRHLSIKGRAKWSLFYFPLAFIGFTLLSSALNGVLHGIVVDYLGLGDLFICITATLLGLVVYQLASKSPKFVDHLYLILMWAPAANIVALCIAVAAGINYLPGFNGFSDPGQSGAGIIGLGGRFQGLASNANIVATQSCIAIGLLLPKLLYPGISVLKKTSMIAYLLALCAVIVGSGVRAALVVLLVMLVLFIWMTIRLTVGGLLRTLGIAILAATVFGITLVAINSFELLQVMLERLESEDGRLLLWSYYGELLFSHPFGFGLGFESIVDTAVIQPGQRLPPHNSFLQAGMYAGFAGAVLSLILLHQSFNAILRIKQAMHFITPPVELVGISLAWVSVVINLVFAGMYFANFNFTILTALMFAGSSNLLLPSRRSGRELKYGGLS